MPFANTEMMTSYQQQWHQDNKTRRIEAKAEKRAELKIWLQEYKSTLKCERCDESHIACLDFHHKEASEKEFVLSKAVNNGYSREKIIKEISKCSVLCSNCHRKLHYTEGYLNYGGSVKNRT